MFYSVISDCLIPVKADPKAQHQVYFSNHYSIDRSRVTPRIVALHKRSMKR